MAERNYIVFRRSARNFDEFVSARKYTIDRNLTIEEARRACAAFNDHRTEAQIARGTKYEFTTKGRV